MKKISLFAAIVLTALLTKAPAADADVAAESINTPAWNMVASGCVLDATSASKASTNGVFSSVTFTTGATGIIRMICPISHLDANAPAPNLLNVTYTDPDNSASRCQVRAQLRRTSKGSPLGDFTIASFFSQPNTGGRTVDGVLFLNETINLEQNYYWVDLELHRSDTGCNPSVNGTWLDHQIQ